MGPGRGLDTEKTSAQKTKLWVSWELDPQKEQGRKTKKINDHETEIIIKQKRKIGVQSPHTCYPCTPFLQYRLYGDGQSTVDLGNKYVHMSTKTSSIYPCWLLVIRRV